MPLHFLLRKEFRTAEAACEVARVDPHMVHVILELLVALEAELVDAPDLHFVHVQHVLRRLDLRDEGLGALGARIAVHSLLLRQPTVVLHVLPQKRRRHVICGALRAGITRKSVDVHEVLLEVEILAVRLLVIIFQRGCGEGFAAGFAGRILKNKKCSPSKAQNQFLTMNAASLCCARR